MAPDRFANYVPVAERLAEAAPAIQLVTSDPPVMLTEMMGYIRVTVTLKDGCSATGIASFRLDLTTRSAQATNPIEDCETSAVGRALGFLGFSSNRSIATREDVAEAQRRADAPARSTAPPAPASVEMSPTDARERFFARYGERVGGPTWRRVQVYLGSRTPEPTTVEEWVAAGREMVGRIALEGKREQPPLSEEWDAIDQAPQGAAVAVAK
jgi:hypothetical protein